MRQQTEDDNRRNIQGRSYVCCVCVMFLKEKMVKTETEKVEFMMLWVDLQICIS